MGNILSRYGSLLLAKICSKEITTWCKFLRGRYKLDQTLVCSVLGRVLLVVPTSDILYGILVTVVVRVLFSHITAEMDN